jgi:hypothetical protein
MLYIDNFHSVSDGIDDILKMTKDTKKQQKSKSKSSKPLATNLFTEEEEASSTAQALMGTDDILKYIQQNQADNDDDLELF